MVFLPTTKDDNCQSAVERYSRISSSLRDTLAILNSNRDLEEILTFIVKQAKELMEADAVAIYTPAGQKEMLHIQASLGLPEEYIQFAKIPLGMLATGYATQTRQPVFFTDSLLPSEQLKFKMDEERTLVMEKFSQIFRALLAVPLLFPNGEVYGTLDLYFTKPRDFRKMISIWQKRMPIRRFWPLIMPGCARGQKELQYWQKETGWRVICMTRLLRSFFLYH